jgi:hypothetical protein
MNTATQAEAATARRSPRAGPRANATQIAYSASTCATADA